MECQPHFFLLLLDSQAMLLGLVRYHSVSHQYRKPVTTELKSSSYIESQINHPWICQMIETTLFGIQNQCPLYKFFLTRLRLNLSHLNEHLFRQKMFWPCYLFLTKLLGTLDILQWMDDLQENSHTQNSYEAVRIEASTNIYNCTNKSILSILY